MPDLPDPEARAALRRRRQTRPGGREVMNGEDDIAVDANGCLAERVRLGGLDVVIHYDHIPAKDRTTVDGIPCTTALRTVIDLAPDMGAEALERMVTDCLRRGLFMVDEARARIAEADMRARPGARLLGRVLPR